MKHSLPIPTSEAPEIEDIVLRLSPSPTSSDPLTLPVSSLAGRVVVFFVFGADCGTCKHLAGLLSGICREFTREVEVIGIYPQTGAEERLEAFRAESGTELTLAHCSNRQLCAALHIPAGTWLFYPTLIFIDQAQRMRGFVVGGDSFFEDTLASLRRILKELAGEQRENEAQEAGEKVEAGV
jgi:thiol-disulfide isomerase/thioredoxin